jgi:2,4-dienoyl-CoA reductase-like NADH-dependent reductase (Old Yellow Enzyme family)
MTSTNLSHLLSPLTLKARTLKNRVVMVYPAYDPACKSAKAAV